MQKTPHVFNSSCIFKKQAETPNQPFLPTEIRMQEYPFAHVELFYACLFKMLEREVSVWYSIWRAGGSYLAYWAWKRSRGNEPYYREAQVLTKTMEIGVITTLKGNRKTGVRNSQAFTMPSPSPSTKENSNLKFLQVLEKMTTRFISFNEEKEKNHLWKSGLHLINHIWLFWR